MRIQQAQLRDVPTLAWVAARAFAAETSRAGVRRRACGLYLMHLYNLAALAARGTLWHGDRKALIVVEPMNQRSWWKWLVSTALGIMVLLGLAAWIPTFNDTGLRISIAATLLVLMALLPALIAGLGEVHPRRDVRNSATIRRWYRSLSGQQVCKISYLAMYPQTGEGLVFARAAIVQVATPGAALCAVSRSDKHTAIYVRSGFQRLLTADGTPTSALVFQRELSPFS